MWTRDALLFAIFLTLIHIAGRLPATDSSQPLLAAAGLIGVAAFVGRTTAAIAGRKPADE